MYCLKDINKHSFFKKKKNKNKKGTAQHSGKGQSPSAGQDAVTDQISTAFDICELEQAQYQPIYQVSDWKLRTRGKCDP